MTTGKNRKIRALGVSVGRLLVTIILAGGLCCPVWALAAGPVTAQVGVLPLQTAGGGRYSSLAPGIREMLVSRLAGPAEIRMLPAARVERLVTEVGGLPADLSGLFAALEAEYLIGGTLGATGNGGWQLAVELFRAVAPGQATQSLEVGGASEQEIVAAVNRLAGELAGHIRAMEQAVEGETALQTATSEELASFRTAHPERRNLEIMPLTGVFQVGHADLVHELPLTINAVDIGDVNGDGRDELVVADAVGRVEVRTIGEAEPLRQAQVALGGEGLVIHALSMADLNDNGRDEIYVSGQAGVEPRSFVLEWDGTELAVVLADLPWCIRVAAWPDQGNILLGQSFSGPTAGQIFRLESRAGGLLPGPAMSVPGQGNLFDFAFGDLDGDGQPEAIALDPDDHLRVYDQEGHSRWRSDAPFCATHRKINGARKTEELIPLFAKVRHQIAVRARIVVLDFDGDGAMDVVANENPGIFSRFLEGDKSLPSGVIQGLTWDGNGLRRIWQTAGINGYVVDYQVRAGAEAAAGDVSRPRLYVAVTEEPGFLLGRGAGGAVNSLFMQFNLDLGWLF